jgi:hypothetical protein
MQEKILGKYQIITEQSASLKIGRYNDNDYRIEIVSKTPQSGKYSEIAKNINAVSHKNISNLKIEEDNENFYFVDKNFGEGFSALKADWFGKNYDSLNYVSLIKCYLQIIDAVSFIHQKGFYHGNINPKNIIIDRNDNAYLLDFGRCYIYAMLSDKPNKQFYAPEQITQNECHKESDIYSLGLCMLNLLIESQFESFSFLEAYKDFSSLEYIYEKITTEEERLDKINAGLFLLIKKMLKILPDERENLINVRKELTDLLNSILPHKTFAIRIFDKVLETWRENHSCDRYTEKQDIQSKIDGYRAYWEFGKDKSDRDEIKIAAGNVVFCCSAHEDNEHFFCFHIIENPNVIERQEKYGLPTDDKFKIVGQNEFPGDCAYAGIAVFELRKRYEQKQLENTRYETDKKSIATEEELLEAEKKTIEEKKNTRKVILREIDKGSDTITLAFVPEKDVEELDENEDVLKNKTTEKDFKSSQKVILQSSINSEKELSGTILQSKTGEAVTVQFEKYTVLKNLPKTSRDTESVEDEEIKKQKPTLLLVKDEEYYLSYDYQVEEIIWNKRNRALEELQNGNTQIPNFLRKINRPEEFIKNDLIDVSNFYNAELDENQKCAVQKSLSLSNDCEVLVLQGPPGTGKTTTITEIVTQILKTRPHEKVLIASQSNQAVDNVLEKI